MIFEEKVIRSEYGIFSDTDPEPGISKAKSNMTLDFHHGVFSIKKRA